jgi:TonB family protein
MKLFAFLLIFFISLNAISQTTLKFYDGSWKECDASLARFYSLKKKTDSGWYRRDYFANLRTAQMIGLYEDSNCKIPNGMFYYFYANSSIETIGRYQHGKKTGLWLTYHYNGMMADSVVYSNDFPIGTRLGWHSNGNMADSMVYNEDSSGIQVTWFDNGIASSAGYLAKGYKMNGKWQFFHKNGQLASLETYSNGILVNKEYYDESGNSMKDTIDRSHAAAFPGGSKAWQSYLGNKAYFPDQYTITNADEASVTVSFSVNEEGNVVDAYVSVPFHPDFDKIALDAIQRSPKWIPATSNNRKITYNFVQPVTFSQKEE